MMHFLLRPTFLLLLFAAFSSAWPWPRFLPDIDALVVRDGADATSAAHTTASNTASNTGSAAASQTNTASNTEATSKKATKSQTGTGTITSAPKSESSGSSASTSDESQSSSSTAKKASTTTYDPRLPAGGISLITPAVASGSQFYKIGDYVTFAWNYTSLSATPTAINVLASCAANKELYTIAMNQSVGDTTGAVTWDTGSYQSTAADPLPVATYTLVIYDASSEITSVPGAGYLAVYDSYAFGMYTPQAYTPLADGFQCATCSAALSSMERQALGFMFAMGSITVLSFTWFVGGLNIIW